jgi:hypothetical protein
MRLLVVTLALVALSPVGAASAATSPARLYAASLAAARAEHSVHYVSTLASSSVSVSFVGDAATDRGSQRITFRKSGRSGLVTVLVVADTAYIRGDAFTLAGYMGFRPAQAARYAGRWISIPPSSPAFGTVAAGVRLRSTIDELKLRPPYMRLSKTIVDGQQVIGIRGHAPVAGQLATGILYVRARPAPLPVAETAELSGQHSRVTFSKWNEGVRVAAPTHAVPITSVH